MLIIQKVGWVNGNGNTSDEKHYTFTDTKPLLGMNYYRLRQIDFDGRFEYSHIVSVTFETDEVEIYPNPATDKLFILGGKKDRYVIYNFFGEIIKSFPISESTSLDIEDLNPGIYWIKSMNKGQAMRFVKL
ncbi:MAG: T9SS type A sorting domain-containing protein [Saprospiraceae bacterium]|nr:T9SS type A sorting domain-containing protein [Saprospiraceae bacterium]